MRKFLAALLFLFASCVFAQGTTPAVASPERAARIEHAREVLQTYADVNGVKGRAIVTDTGQDVELVEGTPSPVIVIKLPSIGRVCVLAMHPTEDLFATLVCEDREPETEI